jgi:thymidylate synthase ThyX
VKYIKKTAEEGICGLGYVQLWDFSLANLNEEARVEAVATVASICYGKPPKDAKKLVERLWTESGGLPSSAFEFVRDGRAPKIENSLRNYPHLATYKKDPALSDEETAKRHRTSIAVFRIKVPIFIARQIMRHRTFSYQELSRRYADDKRAPLAFWMPAEEEVGATAVGLFRLAYSLEEKIYRLLRGLNVRAEIARAVLGTGLYTELWMMGDRAAWANYFTLRLDHHTQKEHRLVAQTMQKLLQEHQSEFVPEPG